MYVCMMDVHAISHRQIEKYSFTRVDFHNSQRLCVTPGTRESSTLEMNKNKNNKKKLTELIILYSLCARSKINVIILYYI